MDRTFDTVLEEVFALDRESQIEIAEKIMGHVQMEPTIEAAWRAEARSRLDLTAEEKLLQSIPMK